MIKYQYDTIDEMVESCRQHISTYYGASDNAVCQYLVESCPDVIVFSIKSEKNTPSKYDLMLIHAAQNYLRKCVDPNSSQRYKDSAIWILEFYKHRDRQQY